eukprot:891717-Pyramimonas_sp.AAC.2
MKRKKSFILTPLALLHIQGSNLLIDNKGVLKLADFGLARPWAQENANALTNRVITLWYREAHPLWQERDGAGEPHLSVVRYGIYRLSTLPAPICMKSPTMTFPPSLLGLSV